MRLSFHWAAATLGWAKKSSLRPLGCRFRRTAPNISGCFRRGGGWWRRGLRGGRALEADGLFAFRRFRSCALQGVLTIGLGLVFGGHPYFLLRFVLAFWERSPLGDTPGEIRGVRCQAGRARRPKTRPTYPHTIARQPAAAGATKELSDLFGAKNKLENAVTALRRYRLRRARRLILRGWTTW
jgi:hypothetical protein